MKCHRRRLDLSGATWPGGDTSALGKSTQSFLKLRGDDIIDVSSLGNVHTLELARCDKLKNLSGLGKNSVVDLRGCQNVQDVSKLCNVATLNIGNTGVKDVAALSALQTLYVEQSEQKKTAY